MKKKIIAILMLAMFVICMTGCEPSTPSSTSGVKKATTTVKTQADGNTIEQQNIINRLKIDNTLGSIKHLYVISAYSGQVLIYSTVKGKVTSSGKRLSPYTVSTTTSNYGIPIEVGNHIEYTGEVLQDDGTYGSSIQYLYWWDSTGKYHQHYVSGGQIIHISDQPLVVPEIIINMEATVN